MNGELTRLQKAYNDKITFSIKARAKTMTSS